MTEHVSHYSEGTQAGLIDLWARDLTLGDFWTLPPILGQVWKLS